MSLWNHEQREKCPLRDLKSRGVAQGQGSPRLHRNVHVSISPGLSSLIKTCRGNQLSLTKIQIRTPAVSAQRRINIPGVLSPGEPLLFTPASKLFPESHAAFLYEAPLFGHFRPGGIRPGSRCCISSVVCARYFVARSLPRSLTLILANIDENQRGWDAFIR